MQYCPLKTTCHFWEIQSYFNFEGKMALWKPFVLYRYNLSQNRKISKNPMVSQQLMTFVEIDTP